MCVCVCVCVFVCVFVCVPACTHIVYLSILSIYPPASIRLSVCLVTNSHSRHSFTRQIRRLERDNTKLTTENAALQEQLDDANKRIEQLETSTSASPSAFPAALPIVALPPRPDFSREFGTGDLELGRWSNIHGLIESESESVAVRATARFMLAGIARLTSRLV